jgi:hypothetical protein
VKQVYGILGKKPLPCVEYSREFVDKSKVRNHAMLLETYKVMKKGRRSEKIVKAADTCMHCIVMPVKFGGGLSISFLRNKKKGSKNHNFKKVFGAHIFL